MSEIKMTEDQQKLWLAFGMLIALKRPDLADIIKPNTPRPGVRSEG